MRFSARGAAVLAVLLLSSCVFRGTPPVESSGSAAAAGPAHKASSDGWPAMPVPGRAKSFAVPPAQRFTLHNGIPLTVIQTGSVPLVALRLNVYAGSALDPAGKAGLADFSADLLNEGTASRSALQISEELLDLASSTHAGAELDYSYAGLDCLEDKLEPTLAIFADLLMNPAFRDEDLERVRQERRASLLAEKDQLGTVAWKVFQKILFGDEYLGRPSRGTLDSLAALTRDDVVDWHRRNWQPGNAGLVVASRLEPAALLDLLNKHLGGWQPAASAQAGAASPSANPPIPLPSSRRPGRQLFWVDRPGAAQSYLLIGNVAPAFDAATQAPRTLANSVLGGGFVSRVNLNLREQKGYTYGARSTLSASLRAGTFSASASVKTAVTAPSIVEFIKEIEDITKARPISDEEFGAARGRALLGWPSQWEGIGGVLGQFASADALRRPADWLSGYEDRVRKVSNGAARKAVADFIDPSALVLLVVGDRSAAGADVEALGLGPIVALDDEGRPQDAPAAPPTPDSASPPVR